MKTTVECKTVGRLPELPESEAVGRVAAIYGEIKRLQGVPMLALIFRHMATLPGALEWSWDILRPVMQTGFLQDRAWELMGSVRLPAVVPISMTARRTVGMTAADDMFIANVLAAFNRTNAVNVVALHCLEKHLMSPGVIGGEIQRERRWSPPPSLPALPPMVDPADMCPELRAAISELFHRDGTRYRGIWPSLYRYFARVPAYLAFATVVLPPAFVGIDRAVTELRTRIINLSDKIVRETSAPAAPRPDASVCATLVTAIQQFTAVIPEMFVIGTVLERATNDMPVPG